MGSDDWERERQSLTAALRKARLLSLIGREAAAAQDVATIVESVLLRLSTVVTFKGGAVALIDEGMISLAAARGIVDAAAWNVCLPVGTGIAGWVAANGRSYRSGDIDAAGLVNPAARDVGTNVLIRSYLAVPLMAHGETIGILQIDSAEPDAFDDADQALLEEVAAIVGEATARARRHAYDQAAVRALSLENSALRATAALLGPRNRRLRDETMRLKETEEARDDFVSMIGHDLRTPATAIKGLLQLAINHLADSGVSQAAVSRVFHNLKRTEAEVDRLITLIAELHDVTRIQGRSLGLHRSPIDIAALARAAVDRLQATTTHTLTALIDATAVAWVDGDPGRLDQVLDNLLSNAIKYSPHGGVVSLSLSIVETSTGKDEVWIDILDQGIGIPQEDQARLFGRFNRAGDAVARGIPGLGIGLFVSRGIAEAHGGRLSLVSSTPDGSRFRLSLPLLRTPPAELHL